MKLKSIIFLLFSLFVNGFFAQEIAEDFDLTTYNLYVGKQWKQLIDKGNQAIEEDKGNYFIYYRIGIAYFELKQYRKAIPYFNKAMVFNNIDPTLKEYLYYSYIYTDQYGNAEKTNFKKTAILQMINVEGGSKIYKPTPIFRQSNNYPLLFQKDTLYKDNLIIGGGLLHSIGKGHHLYHNATYIYFHQRNELKYQWQYFMQGDFLLPNQWTIKPALNVMSYSIQTGNNPIQRFPFSDYVFSISVLKQTTAFKFECTNAFSRISDTSIFQHELGAEYYPFFNKKLSIGANIILHGLNYYKVLNPVIIASLKSQPIPLLEAQLTYYYSKASFVSEQNAFFVYNNPDRLQQRIQLLLNININPHIVPYFLYNFEEKYHTDPRTNNEISFTNHTLLTGIKILFN